MSNVSTDFGFVQISDDPLAALLAEPVRAGTFSHFAIGQSFQTH
jgi:hypothetical protein